MTVITDFRFRESVFFGLDVVDFFLVLVVCKAGGGGGGGGVVSTATG